VHACARGESLPARGVTAGAGLDVPLPPEQYVGPSLAGGRECDDAVKNGHPEVTHRSERDRVDRLNARGSPLTLGSSRSNRLGGTATGFAPRSVARGLRASSRPREAFGRWQDSHARDGRADRMMMESPLPLIVDIER